MHLHLKRQTGAIVLAIGALIATLSGAAMAQEISQSEKLLFQTNHFDNVKKPVKISYTYQQAAAAPDAFTDEASVEVVQHNADGTASVTAHFLSGTREIPIPPIEHAQGNPVILGFLERDIAEMKRLTGGAIGYFRKRIRLALAAPNIVVKKIDVAYDGRQIAAQEITIHPYADDPLKDRFAKLADKGYVFIISDAVPGSLYRLYTTIPSATATPVVDASMTVARGDGAALLKTGLVTQKR